MSFTLCEATHHDVPALAMLHVAGWRAAYDGLVPADFLAALSEDEKRDEWARWLDGGLTALIARTADGTAAGFASFGRLKTPPPGMSPIRPLYSAEIYALYILPDFWRQGLGRRLLAASAAALKAQKHTSMCLWVADGNKRAAAFYKAMGGERCGRKSVEIGGRTLTDLCFGWRSTAGLLAEAG